jgi:hypothetical protein
MVIIYTGLGENTWRMYIDSTRKTGQDVRWSNTVDNLSSMQIQSYPPPPIKVIVEAHQQLEEGSISLQEEN